MSITRPAALSDSMLGRYVDIGAELLGLQLSPASRQEVIDNLRVLHTRAQEFTDIELDDALEPAPVFRL